MSIKQDINKKMVDDLYRKSVGIVILNQKKKIFIGKRLKGQDIHQYWQMPQGGIDAGEDEETAMKRELFEETGIKTINIFQKSEKYNYYNFPHEIRKNLWKGRYIGQKQRWFLVEFTGNESEININVCGDNAEFSQWKWENAENVITEIVAFKKEIYQEVLSNFNLL
jgi:putative (di)nucleoside polyphosphate hydrolase